MENTLRTGTGHNDGAGTGFWPTAFSASVMLVYGSSASPGTAHGNVSPRVRPPGSRKKESQQRSRIPGPLTQDDFSWQCLLSFFLVWQRKTQQIVGNMNSLTGNSVPLWPGPNINNGGRRADDTLQNIILSRYIAVVVYSKEGSLPINIWSRKICRTIR